MLVFVQMIAIEQKQQMIVIQDKWLVLPALESSNNCFIKVKWHVGGTKNNNLVIRF
jgi:hypothetical protein